MDLQVKLLNDGYAMTYRSPEAPNLPDWAKWKDQAWGITAEPIVIVYNKRLVAEDQVPRSHVALRKWLEATGPNDRREVATYDPVRSAVGYLYLSQDEQASNDVWRLVRAMARNNVRLYTSAEEVLRDVSAGRVAIGYNIVGSYALDEMSKNPNIGVVLPQDYTLVMSRIAMIPSRARHPAAAKLFLDFLLSRQGQRRLAERRITPARGDIDLPPRLEPTPRRCARSASDPPCLCRTTSSPASTSLRCGPRPSRHNRESAPSRVGAFQRRRHLAQPARSSVLHEHPCSETTHEHVDECRAGAAARCRPFPSRAPYR